VIVLLKQPAGATLKAILAMTGRQAHGFRLNLHETTLMVDFCRSFMYYLNVYTMEACHAKSSGRRQ
jgi:hypothetical protein